jgi:hypothetical protein
MGDRDFFIYSIKLHPHFNDSFHKTTDERYFENP